MAVSALQQMMSLYITGGAAEVFDAIQAPVVCVNADLWPVNYEANRRHMAFFETITLQGADHFLMLNRGEEFNRALEKAIDKVRATARAKGKP